MGTSFVIAALAAASSLGASIPGSEVERQNTIFQRYWGTDFVWKFDELPSSARVPSERIPYSGYIYPDNGGGTVSALSKYDYAFNRGRSSAAAHERWDTTAFQETAAILITGDPDQTGGRGFGIQGNIIGVDGQ